MISELHRLFLAFLLFLCLVLNGIENDDLLLFDDDTATFQLEATLSEYIEPPDNRIFINWYSREELLRLTTFSSEEIDSIINYRKRGGIKGIDCLLSIGIPQERLTYLLPHLSFRAPTEISYRQTTRFYYRKSSTDQTPAQYHRSELSTPRLLFGMVGAGNSGYDLTKTYSYYLSYSAHPPQRFTGFTPELKQLNMGRYRLALGQGVAFAPMLGFSKSSATTTQPIKNYRPLQPHRSPYPMWSLEGVAVQVQIANLELLPFYSETKLNASIEEDKVRTIYPYGFPSRERKNSLTEQIKGLSLRYFQQRNTIGIYYSQHSFSHPFLNESSPQSYSAYGAHFQLRSANVIAFGEAASIANKRGFVSGLRWGDRDFQQLLLYRHYDRDIPHWHGNPFSSQSNFNNEEGLYYGIQYRPKQNLTLNLFFDLWKHPSPRYFEKMPTTRSEQYLRLTYRLPEETIRLKIHHKKGDRYRVFDDKGKIYRESRITTSLDWTCQLSANIRKRSGIDYVSLYITENGHYQDGFLIYENLNWSYRRLNLIFNIAFYKSDVSHYVYEYSLDGMWESRPLSGDDIYNYLIVKANLFRDFSLQGKLAHSYSNRITNFFTQLIYQM